MMTIPSPAERRPSPREGRRLAVLPAGAQVWRHRPEAAGFPVALVCMPFASHVRPSLQVGLLAAVARRCGFPVSTFHLNLDFAAALGPSLYERLGEHRGFQLGDWLFSRAAFGAAAPDPDDRFPVDFPVRDMLADPHGSDQGGSVELLREIRNVRAPEFIEELADRVPWGTFRVVGFTSTFQQSVASFALARAIKRRHPDVVCVFGGANFDGGMGVEHVRAIGSIDFAVSGEGDIAFPALLTALLDGSDPTSVPGVVCRREGGVRRRPPAPLLRELDELPVPDYDEFFERAEGLALLPRAARRAVDLPFESARGCWWGEKHHCTFCGLNATGMAFRAKSAQRLGAELRELTTRYRSFQLEAVDNILAMPLLAELFPELARQGTDYEFFFEVKANLTRDQIASLARGGVRRIQPGIESLSSPILKLMRKGVRGVQNVNVLRWATYYGIDVAWNIIWGFPGESIADYEAQLALARRLVHLPPPSGAGRVWLERFSPLFGDGSASDALQLRPEKSYGYVYPGSVDLKEIAYFFDYELSGTLDESERVFHTTREHVQAWGRRWRSSARPTLTYRFAPGLVQVDDLRNPDEPGTFTLRDPLAAVYVHCSDRPHTVPRILADLRLDLPPADLETALDRLCEQGIMMRDGDLFLTLAMPATGGR